MKRFGAVILAAALLAGCNGVNYKITGVDMPEEITEVKLLTADGATVLTEATVDTDGKAALKGKCDEPMLAILTDGDENPLTVVFVESGDIVVSYDPAYDEFTVSGTAANDNFVTANERLDMIRARFYQVDDDDEEAQQAIVDAYTAEVNQIIDENNDNILGAYLFTNIAANMMEPAEIHERIARFPKQIRELEAVRELNDYAAASLKVGEGERYVEIEAADLEGETVTLSSLVDAGNWVLVDFWATWCGPCRGEIPYLREAWAQFSDKNFVILGVSLDNDLEAWRTYVEDNDMVWINVSGIDGERKSPAAEAYAVRSIPSNFLISPEGVIVARNLRGEGVAETLSKYLD